MVQRCYLLPREDEHIYIQFHFILCIIRNIHCKMNQHKVINLQHENCCYIKQIDHTTTNNSC